MLLRELTEAPGNVPKYLYKWVTLPQFQKYLDAGKLPVKRGYAHYIEQKDDFVKGNSFTDEQHIGSWTGNALIKIDTSTLNNQIFPVAGNRTYLRTMGMTKKDFDPDAWKFESEEIDEYWIAGPVNLSSAEVVKKI